MTSPGLEPHGPPNGEAEESNHRPKKADTIPTRGRNFTTAILAQEEGVRRPSLISDVRPLTSEAIGWHAPQPCGTRANAQKARAKSHRHQLEPGRTAV
jgi:hypothetical protein